jgi:hypothetical protein
VTAIGADRASVAEAVGRDAIAVLTDELDRVGVEVDPVDLTAESRHSWDNVRGL